MTPEIIAQLNENIVTPKVHEFSLRCFIDFFLERATTQQMAELYAKIGIYVVPLYQPVGQGCSCGKPDCTSIGKHPKSANGHHGASNDVAKVANWPHWETSNIGIAVEPTGWVVIDIDPGHGGRLDALPLAPEDLNTQIAATGGKGVHLVYRAPTGFKVSQSNKRLPPGIDVRSRGYIVAPPSLHASGNRYRWLQGHSPFELQPLPLPADLMEVLVKVEEVEHPIHSGPVPIYSRERSTRQSETEGKKTLEAIIENGLMRLAQSQPGNRNNTLNEVAYVFGIQIAIGWLPRPEAERMLTDAALAKGLSEAETLKTINSGLNAGMQAHQQKS